MGRAERLNAARRERGDIIGTVAILAHETGRYSASWHDLHHLIMPGNVKTITKYSTNLAEARNECVRQMEGDWIFWWDDDMRVPPDTLIRLLSRREAIVQPVCLTRYPPFESVMMGPPTPEGDLQWRQALVDGQEGVLSVHAVGAACSLVRRFVYDHMDDPWYRTGELSMSGLGEDIGFCRRAREAGFISTFDLDTPVGHMNVAEMWPYRDEDGKWWTLIKIGDQVVAQIEAAQPKHEIAPDGTVIREWDKEAA